MRRRAQRYRELHPWTNLAGEENAAADQRHGVCGKSAAPRVTTPARRQHANGCLLGEFDRAVLSCIRTTTSRLWKLKLAANHRDEDAVSSGNHSEYLEPAKLRMKPRIGYGQPTHTGVRAA